MDALRTSLGAAVQGSGLLVDGSFRINDLQTTYLNAEDGNLNFTTTMMVEIPLSLGSEILPPIRKDIEVRTAYEPKF